MSERKREEERSTIASSDWLVISVSNNDHTTRVKR